MIVDILSRLCFSSLSFRDKLKRYSVVLFSAVGDFAEARNQVMEATERLGGLYSPNLHPQCTHLVVQISFSALNYTFFPTL